MERTYTLKEVAYILSVTKESGEIERIARQVRHWTLSDLLETVGEKYTGTGRSRRYAADEIRLAAWLVELAKYGVNVSIMEFVRTHFDNYAENGYWERVANSEVPVFYEMTWDENGIAGKVSEGEPELIVFSQRAGRRRPEKKELPGILSTRNITSVVTVNLTKIFSRLEL